jgi:hypothetical protein
MELMVNRYGETTPTAIQSNGVAISTPIYIQLTKVQNKTILNAIRTAITRDGDAVVSELGVSEANLRHLLFARNGLPERLLLKLQAVTGLEMVSKEQIEDTYQSWITHLYQ